MLFKTRCRSPRADDVRRRRSRNCSTWPCAVPSGRWWFPSFSFSNSFGIPADSMWSCNYCVRRSSPSCRLLLPHNDSTTSNAETVKTFFFVFGRGSTKQFDLSLESDTADTRNFGSAEIFLSREQNERRVKDDTRLKRKHEKAFDWCICRGIIIIISWEEKNQNFIKKKKKNVLIIFFLKTKLISLRFWIVR